MNFIKKLITLTKSWISGRIKDISIENLHQSKEKLPKNSLSVDDETKSSLYNDHFVDFEIQKNNEVIKPNLSNAYTSDNAKEIFKIDYIQIEDDFIHIMVWELKAKEYGIHGVSFDSYQSLHDEIDHIPKSTPFFIDIYLTDSNKDGTEIAYELFQGGFTELYLSTAKLASEVKADPWIKQVVGKDFPDSIIPVRE